MLLATSCELGNDDIQVVTTGVEDTFQVNLLEDLENNPRSFAFDFKSLERQACENYAIKHELQRQASGQFILTIQELAPPSGGCEGEEAVAEEMIKIGVLPLGIHEVEINLRDAITNKGVLEVTEEGYEIILDSHAGLKFPYWKLLRIPEQSFWGYVGFYDRPNDSEDRHLPTKFIEKLGNFADKVEPAPGYYGHFVSDSLNQMTLVREVELIEHEPFLFTHFDNIDEIRAETERYKNNANNPNFFVKIFTSDGDVFFSDREVKSGKK